MVARCSVAVDSAEAWASGVEDPEAGVDSSVWERDVAKEEETGTTITVEVDVVGTAADDLGGGTMTSRSVRASRRLTCGRSGPCWKRWTLTGCRS